MGFRGRPADSARRPAAIGAVNDMLMRAKIQTKSELGLLVAQSLANYHAIYVRPIADYLNAPWYMKLWWNYGRPILELYGLPPVDEGLEEVPPAAPEPAPTLIETP